jgi:hypothetical protein
MVMGGTVTDDESDEWLVLDQKVCACHSVDRKKKCMP